MQWVVDHALVSADRDLLLVLALGFGMLIFLFAPTLNLVAIASALLYGLLRCVSHTPLAAIRATRVTRVIVAHRSETIRSADRVINLAEIVGHAVAHRPALPGAGRAVGPAGPAAQIGSI